MRKIIEAFVKESNADDWFFHRGKTYMSIKEIPYCKVFLIDKYPDDYNYSEDFVKKYTKSYKGEDWIVFSKRTKFKCTSVDEWVSFLVDGEYVGFEEGFNDTPEIYFKEL